MTHPIVIIGSGMAGYTFAREFRKLDTLTPLMMISADDAANYAKPTLSNALVGNKHPDQIALGDAAKMSSQLNLQIVPNSTLSAIDVTAHQVTYYPNSPTTRLATDSLDDPTSSTDTLQATPILQPYRQLVLALGATPIRLPIAGDGAADIHVVNSLNDYRAFRNSLAFCTNKRVLLLGAGLIGCEFANDLSATQHAVVVVDIAPQPLGRLLPAEIANAFQRHLEGLGVEFALHTTVKHIERQAGAYRVTLTNGRVLLVDIILSAIGLKPNLDIARAANIGTDRGICVNSLLETTQPDIYAIGDCAEVEGHVLPYVMPLMQQARALAKTLSGTPTRVHYPAMPIAVKTPVAPLTVLPVPANVAVNWQHESFDDGLLARALDPQGNLRGFVLLGATAGKQRLALTRLVPDLIAPT